MLGIVVLAVEGLYVYRFYEDSANLSSATDETASERSSAWTNGSENPKPDRGDFGAALMHRASPENIVDNSTYLDDPRTNENPDAFISVTPVLDTESGSGIANDHAIGVWYDANRLSWAIFNQDREAMPAGAAFQVVISEQDPPKEDK